MRPVDRYKRHYRRFTWQNRVAYGTLVLSRKRHTPKDECSFYSVIPALESNLRLRHRFAQDLSIKYLKQKHEKIFQVNAEMRKMGRVERLMKMLKEIGVPSDTNYNLILQRRGPVCPMHKIAGYKKYDVSQYGHIRAALGRHLRYGPMVAVFWISGNYDNCMKYGSVYRFTGVHALLPQSPHDDKEMSKEEELDRKKRQISHAVCVVSFGIEETVPFFLFRIDQEGMPNFGRVEVQSVIELYGFNM